MGTKASPINRRSGSGNVQFTSDTVGKFPLSNSILRDFFQKGTLVIVSHRLNNIIIKSMSPIGI